MLFSSSSISGVAYFEYEDSFALSRTYFTYKNTVSDELSFKFQVDVGQLDDVKDASVVITNPTHFAIAMKYDPETMSAPLLVAKGQDLVAFKIREIAEENDITIVENKPLAQALYFGVDIDDEVPEEHYKAVAEIISYVWNVKGRSMPAPVGEPAAAAE